MALGCLPAGWRGRAARIAGGDCYAADDWSPLGSFFNDGNRGCGVGHYFLARGARQVATPDAGDLEEIAVELHSLDALLAATRSGEVNVLSIAAALGLAKAAITL
ncbi:MAG: hypothetical protein U0232_08675 [Thermomicrobiales bacterium]